MKRIVIILATFLLFSCAAAEELSPYAVKFIADYNIYADTVFGVPHLPLTGWETDGMYATLFEDDITVNIAIIAEKHIAVYILTNEKIDGDFIAKCACIAAAVSGDTKGIYNNLLTIYFKSRMTPMGEEITLTTAEGYMLIETREDLFLFGMCL